MRFDFLFWFDFGAPRILQFANELDHGFFGTPKTLAMLE